MKYNKVIRIPTKMGDTFFQHWYAFLKPFHQLTDREMEVLACFAKHRYELSKSISDIGLIDKVLMSEETKRAIRKECNITMSYFQVMMSKFRRNKVLQDGKINPKFLPDLDVDSNTCNLLIQFVME